MSLFAFTYHLSPITYHPVVEAAVSKGSNQQLEAGGTNQGGGTVTSQQFRQQVTFGEAIAGNRISSARFRLVPGFLGAALSGATSTPVSELDLSVLYALTEPLGVTIVPSSWQKDTTPLFVWEPPATGPDVAGYSYAIDAQPDDVIDTTTTSFDVSTSALHRLSDGRHTFSVQAINSAGHAGKPIAFDIWVDTTPPQMSGYAPSPSALLNTATPSVSATISDPGSGVNQSTVTLLVNGSTASVLLNEKTGTITSTTGAWKEGTNSIELRASDVVGNAQVPLVWSVTIDTKPPVGTLTINAGSSITTSIYVTLGLSASDATSGVARMLISNDALSGYVEEPYAATRALWKLNAVRGQQRVYVKFVDQAGNVSAPVSDDIELGLLAPETLITSGPAGFSPNRTVSFTFMCPESDCVFSYAFDEEDWSVWSSSTTATKADVPFGNHYFRVKAAKEVNGVPGIQPDEEDPSPAERTWIVGVEPSVLAVPKGPSIKLWRLE